MGTTTAKLIGIQTESGNFMTDIMITVRQKPIITIIIVGIVGILIWKWAKK